MKNKSDLIENLSYSRNRSHRAHWYQYFEEMVKDIDSNPQTIFKRGARVKRTLSRMLKYRDNSKRFRIWIDHYAKILRGPSRVRARDLIILPVITNKVVQVYDGKKYHSINTNLNVGRRLGQFVETRYKVIHSAKTSKGSPKSKK